MASTCKKCGGKKQESDVICDYCHKALERPSTNQVVGRPNIIQAKMLKLSNQATPYLSPPKKYKQLIIKKVLDKT